jgi:alkanesulfonate monooxygenase
VPVCKGHRGENSIGDTGWQAGYVDRRDGNLKRRNMGIRHFVLYDTPYQHETARVGDALIGRLHESVRRRPLPDLVPAAAPSS